MLVNNSLAARVEVTTKVVILVMPTPLLDGVPGKGTEIISEVYRGSA